MNYDLFIIGGGVNGCAIARDAAGRGLSVFLAEQNDLASGTSSASTKLIHGGLRYLEHYEFRLVREALIEREVLLKSAPHIIWPLRFILPHHSGLRPRWLIRLGLFMYDHLGGRKILPPTRSIDFRTDATGQTLKPEFTDGFEYSESGGPNIEFAGFIYQCGPKSRSQPDSGRLRPSDFFPQKWRWPVRKNTAIRPWY